LVHNILFLVDYNLRVDISSKNKEYIDFFKKIGFSLKKDYLVPNLNKIEVKENTFSDIKKPKNLNKVKLIKLNVFVPILTENKHLSKKEL
jgi:uncharacterized protein YxjI